ncbi:hypothetical protein RJ035_004654 [Blastomyces gilchristii]
MPRPKEAIPKVCDPRMGSMKMIFPVYRNNQHQIPVQLDPRFLSPGIPRMCYGLATAVASTKNPAKLLGLLVDASINLYRIAKLEGRAEGGAAERDGSFAGSDMATMIVIIKCEQSGTEPAGRLDGTQQQLAVKIKE